MRNYETDDCRQTAVKHQTPCRCYEECIAEINIRRILAQPRRIMSRHIQAARKRRGGQTKILTIYPNIHYFRLSTRIHRFEVFECPCSFSDWDRDSVGIGTIGHHSRNDEKSPMESPWFPGVGQVYLVGCHMCGHTCCVQCPMAIWRGAAEVAAEQIRGQHLLEQ